LVIFIRRLPSNTPKARFLLIATVAAETILLAVDC
jgi:hypothetical protein